MILRIMALCLLVFWIPCAVIGVALAKGEWALALIMLGVMILTIRHIVKTIAREAADEQEI